MSGTWPMSSGTAAASRSTFRNGHGSALAFPYGFLPWFSAALFRPLLGDWVVTLWLVAGRRGHCCGAPYGGSRSCAKPLPLALFLANPFMVEAVLLGQFRSFGPRRHGSSPWVCGGANGSGRRCSSRP